MRIFLSPGRDLEWVVLNINPYNKIVICFNIIAILHTSTIIWCNHFYNSFNAFHMKVSFYIKGYTSDKIRISFENRWINAKRGGSYRQSLCKHQPFNRKDQILRILRIIGPWIWHSLSKTRDSGWLKSHHFHFRYTQALSFQINQNILWIRYKRQSQKKISSSQVKITGAP